MKKKTKKAKTTALKEKNVFRQAGEVIGTIGATIVHARENVANAAGFVADEFVHAKKAAKKVVSGLKKTAEKAELINGDKLFPKKSTIKGVGKKAKKVVKKLAKKSKKRKHLKPSRA